jgi:hypothetical protein
LGLHISENALADAVARLDDRPMSATQTAPEPEKKPAGKAASEAQDGPFAFETEQDETEQEETEQAAALSFASAALDRVTGKLDDAASDLKGIVHDLESASDPQQLRDAQQALAQIQEIKDNLGLMFKKFRRKRKDPGDAFSAVAQMSALVSDVEAARERSLASDQPPGPPPDPPWYRRLWEAALKNIREALPHLWAFISRLFTPTQWTATGNAGTGIFGFASASISVTFGNGS